MKRRQILQTAMGLANNPFSWDMAESGHCSRDTIRSVGFWEMGRKPWGALCWYPTPSSFPPPQHTSTCSWLWGRWTGMLDLEMKTPLPLAGLSVGHPAGSPRPLVPGPLLFAVGCLTAWPEVGSLIYHVPTCPSSEKQPPVACLLHCKMLYQY